MASRNAIRTLRSTPPKLRSYPTRRAFISLHNTEPISLSQTRILPYKHTSVYTLIADVDSYSTFVPYCQQSRVTKWSAADKNGKRWPSEADLKIGWGGYEETFTSRLFCVPDSIVEALGGEAVTTLPKKDVEHHMSTFEGPGSATTVFKSLSTRWTVKPFQHTPPYGRPQPNNSIRPSTEQTEVHLTIDFQFSNPIYAALSKAVAPKVAGIMIEAFERRARQLLDGPGATIPEDGQGMIARSKIGA
jgi:coenzyme Q-binding protein COQ10